jgi:hypothetical protein
MKHEKLLNQDSLDAIDYHSCDWGNQFVND